MSKVRLLGLGLVILLAMNLVLIFLLVSEGPVGAGRDRPHHDRSEPKHIIIERLHFDDQQIKEYETLIRKHRADVRETEDQIRSTKNALYRTLSDENHAGRDSLQNDLGRLQRKMEAIHYNHFAQIRNICRKEQFADFAALSNELAGFFDPVKKMPPPPKD